MDTYIIYFLKFLPLHITSPALAMFALNFFVDKDEKPDNSDLWSLIMGIIIGFEVLYLSHDSMIWGNQFGQIPFLIPGIIVLFLFSAALWGLYDITYIKPLTRLFSRQPLNGIFQGLLICWFLFLGYQPTATGTPIDTSFLLAAITPYLMMALFNIRYDKPLSGPMTLFILNSLALIVLGFTLWHLWSLSLIWPTTTMIKFLSALAITTAAMGMSPLLIKS